MFSNDFVCMLCSKRTFRNTYKILSCFLCILKMVLQSSCFPLQEESMLIFSLHSYSLNIRNQIISELGPTALSIPKGHFCLELPALRDMNIMFIL